MVPKLRSSLVGVGMVMVLGGCANQAVPQAAGSSTTSTWAAPTTSPTPGSSPSSSASTAKSSSSALGPADQRLEKALYRLSSQMRAVQASAGPVTGARKELTTAVSAMRGAVKRERVAAYGTSVRDCTAVGAQLTAARTARSDVNGAHGKLVTAVSSRTDDLARLQADITQVRKALAARGSSTAGASAGDVRAAAASAQSQAQDFQTQLRGVDAAAAKTMATAEHLQQAAERIAAKAC